MLFLIKLWIFLIFSDDLLKLKFSGFSKFFQHFVQTFENYSFNKIAICFIWKTDLKTFRMSINMLNKIQTGPMIFASKCDSSTAKKDQHFLESFHFWCPCFFSNWLGFWLFNRNPEIMIWKNHFLIFRPPTVIFAETFLLINFGKFSYSLVK
jgi:hypothetical protein